MVAVCCERGSAGLDASGAGGDAPEARVAAVFARFTEPGQPGCAVGVYRDGRVIVAEGYGLADIEKGIAIDADTVFNIASVSKQFTAFAIRLLAARGMLSLDDPITKFLPELRASAPRVTIRQLIHHTSGLRDYMELLGRKGIEITDVATQKETLDALARQTTAEAPPGTKWSYSNTGYFVLSLIIERVGAQTMKAFAKQHLFAPLEMNHTSIVDTYPAAIAKLARGYTRGDHGDFKIYESRWEQTGDGQVHTTVRDLQKWDENFYTHVLGGPDLLGDMVTPGALATGERLDYASGLRIGRYRGLSTVRHSGGWAGYGAHLLRFPSRHFSVAVLCNHPDAKEGTLAERIAAIYLGDALHAAPPTALRKFDKD